MGYEVFVDKIVTKTGEKPTDEVLKGKKLVGLYFSAGWCGPCKRFTPAVSEMYDKAQKDDPSSFEVLFLSACNDRDQFTDYYAKMPWPAVPYELSQGSHSKRGVGFVRKAKREAGMQQGELGTKFDIQSVPRLVLLDGATGSVLSEKAHETIPAVGDKPESYEWASMSGNSDAEKVWKKLTGQ